MKRFFFPHFFFFFPIHACLSKIYSFSLFSPSNGVTSENRYKVTYARRNIFCMETKKRLYTFESCKQQEGGALNFRKDYLQILPCWLLLLTTTCGDQSLEKGASFLVSANKSLVLFDCVVHVLG